MQLRTDLGYKHFNIVGFSFLYHFFMNRFAGVIVGLFRFFNIILP